MTRSRRTSTLRVAALFVFLAVGVAPRTVRAWTPPAPTADEFDWVRLASDEWLKGEIKAMYEDSLEFDSEELDLLTLDWSDIKELRSATILDVRAKGRRRATGRVVLEKRRLRVGNATEMAFSQDEIISITAGTPREINYWSAKVSAGGTIREGNTQQTEASAQAKLQRRTVTDRIRMDYLGNYARTAAQETANNHRAHGTWDRFATDRFFLRPIFSEYFRDAFQNVSHRLTAGLGAGYQLIDTAQTEWEVAAGPAYQMIWFEDVGPGEDAMENNPAIVAAMVFRHELTRSIDFAYDYRLMLTSERAGRYNHHMVSGLAIELTDRLDLDLTLIWDRTASPQREDDGSLPRRNDWRYMVGVGWNF